MLVHSFVDVVALSDIDELVMPIVEVVYARDDGLGFGFKSMAETVKSVEDIGFSTMDAG